MCMYEFMKSTFKTEGEIELGPREEKKATSGDISCPKVVLVRPNLTTGFLWHIYYWFHHYGFLG